MINLATVNSSRCGAFQSPCGGYVALLDQTGVTICSGGLDESSTSEELIEGDRSNRSGSFPSFEGSGGFSHHDRLDFEETRMATEISNLAEVTYTSAVWTSALSHRLSNTRASETIKARIVDASWCPPPSPRRLVNSKSVFPASSYPFDDSVESPLLALLFVDGSVRIFFKSIFGATLSATAASTFLLKPKWQALWREGATKELLSSFRATAINCSDVPDDFAHDHDDRNTLLSSSPGHALLIMGHVSGISVLSIDYSLMFEASSGAVIIAAQKCPPYLTRSPISYATLFGLTTETETETKVTVSAICNFGKWERPKGASSYTRRKGIAIGFTSGQVLIADLQYSADSTTGTVEEDVVNAAPNFSVEIFPRFRVSLPGSSAISVLRWHGGGSLPEENEDPCTKGYIASSHGSKISLIPLNSTNSGEGPNNSTSDASTPSSLLSSVSSPTSSVFRWVLVKSPLVSCSSGRSSAAEASTIQNAHDLPITGLEFSWRIPLQCGDEGPQGRKRRLQLYSTSLDGSMRSWNCEHYLLKSKEEPGSIRRDPSPLMTMVFAGRLPGLRAAITSQTAQPLLGLVLGGVGLLPSVLRFGEERNFHVSGSMHLAYQKPKPSGYLEVVSLIPQSSNEELNHEVKLSSFSSGFQVIELLSQSLSGMSDQMMGYKCEMRDFVRSIVSISIASSALKRLYIRNSVSSQIWRGVELADSDKPLSAKGITLNPPPRILGFDDQLLEKLFDVKTLFDDASFDLIDLSRKFAAAPLYVSYYAILPILVRKACIVFKKKSTPDLSFDAVVEALRRIICAVQTETENGNDESPFGIKKSKPRKRQRLSASSASGVVEETSGIECTFLGSSFMALRPSDVPEPWAKFALSAGPLLAAAMFARRALVILRMSDYIISLAGSKSAQVDRREILSTYGAVTFWVAAASESIILDRLSNSEKDTSASSKTPTKEEDSEVIEKEKSGTPFLPAFLCKELSAAIDIVNKKVSRAVHAGLDANQFCVYCGSQSKFRFLTQVDLSTNEDSLRAMTAPFAPDVVKCNNGHRVVVNAISTLRKISFTMQS
jgi:hypothetical protein